MSSIPGITIPGTVVHAPGGKMAFEVDWTEDRPATASVTYRCPFERCFDLANQLRGVFVGGGTGLVIPGTPHRFPLSPNLYCYGIKIAPKDDEVRKGDLSGESWFPFNYHTHALVTAHYKAPEFAVDAASATPANQINPHDPAGPIIGCRQRVRVSTSFLVFEGAKLKFQTSGKIIESSDGVPANQVEFSFEYPRLSRDPTEFLLPFKGKVNDAPLWFLPAGHVLFDSFEVDRTFSLAGTEVNCTLTFLGNLDVSWNERLNDEGDPETVQFVSSSPTKTPFTSTNLRAIF